MGLFGGQGLRRVWPALFLLGAIMLNRPFLSIFDRPVKLFGIPLIIIYMLVGWLFSILVILLFRLMLKGPGRAGD